MGELRPDASASGPLVPPADVPDAGVSKARWRLHDPILPCTIYAMAEVRSDNLYVGCNGGRIYRFDGVRAEIALELADTSIVSLLWVASNGDVWAAAQSSYEATATTELHHFDGTKWSKIDIGTKRITSLAGAGTEVWFTTDTQIFRQVGGVFTPTFSPAKGVLRACSFLTPEKGYCVGTAGLAVAWDGTAWLPVTGTPWTAAADVFGVEIDSYNKKSTFFYGEPIDHSNGDHACRIAREAAGVFTNLTASMPCFSRMDVPRKRTGQVSVGFNTHMLIAPSESYGGTLAFNPDADAVEPLCGPIRTFSTGLGNTRAGGSYGLLATIVGAGGTQLALDVVGGSSIDQAPCRSHPMAPPGRASRTRLRAARTASASCASRTGHGDPSRAR